MKNVINEIFKEFRNKKNELEMSVSMMKNEMAAYIHQIVLYGAGSAGIAFLYDLRKIGMEPLFFVDANPDKVGTKCEGVQVIAPDQIVDLLGEEALVIVCINTDGKRYCKSFAEALRKGGHHGVYEKLRKYGCKNIIDYTYFRKCYSIFENETFNAPSCSNVYLMEEHEREIATVYDLLADEMSKVVFEKIVRFRLLDDSLDVPTITQEKQYFEYGFYEKRPDEIFIDCGAYNGISLQTFLRENENRFKAYYGIEPDSKNYKLLTEYVNQLPEIAKNKIVLVKKAVWDNNQKINLYALHGPGSFVSDIGNEQVDTITIDEMLNGNAATYIKMNIEGSEKEALQGAEYTIKKYKPRLAIAGYHRTDDLWKIPLKMREYRKDYKIYLRSYMNHISFVYYAI